MAENVVTFGLSNVYYAPLNVGTDGALTWGTPVKIENAQEFTLSRTTSETPVYADNKLIYVIKGYTGASITLNFSSISDSVKKAILGMVEDANGNLVELTNPNHPYFALILQVQGDKKERRMVFLKCTSNLGDENTGTLNESPTVNSDSLSIAVYPVEDNAGHSIIKYVVDSEDTNYASVIASAPAIPVI